MNSRYLQIATTPSVAAAQEQYGSAAQWRRLAVSGEVGDATAQRLGAAERAFIAERDGFYLASVSETGWPYVQYRGGPAGFLACLDATLLGFADFRGNRQYITIGNVRADDRVSLFLMDYAHRQRLKIFGHMRILDAADDPVLAKKLVRPDYPARVERLVLITVEAFDWNCPQAHHPALHPGRTGRHGGCRGVRGWPFPESRCEHIPVWERAARGFIILIYPLCAPFWSFRRNIP